MSEKTLVGDLIERCKTFLGRNYGQTPGFLLSVLLDVTSLAGRPHTVMEAQEHEWTSQYKQLIRDVQSIIHEHSELATGDDAWHALMDELIDTVRRDYVHV